MKNRNLFLVITIYMMSIYLVLLLRSKTLFYLPFVTDVSLDSVVEVTVVSVVATS